MASSGHVIRTGLKSYYLGFLLTKVSIIDFTRNGGLCSLFYAFIHNYLGSGVSPYLFKQGQGDHGLCGLHFTWGELKTIKVV